MLLPSLEEFPAPCNSGFQGDKGCWCCSWSCWLAWSSEAQESQCTLCQQRESVSETGSQMSSRLLAVTTEGIGVWESSLGCFKETRYGHVFTNIRALFSVCFCYLLFNRHNSVRQMVCNHMINHLLCQPLFLCQHVEQANVCFCSGKIYSTNTSQPTFLGSESLTAWSVWDGLRPQKAFVRKAPSCDI